MADSKNASCYKCFKTVYQMECIFADKRLYHKTCFKCTTCAKTLSIRTFQSYKGTLYCTQHQPSYKTGSQQELDSGKSGRRANTHGALNDYKTEDATLQADSDKNTAIAYRTTRSAESLRETSPVHKRSESDQRVHSIQLNGIVSERVKKFAALAKPTVTQAHPKSTPTSAKANGSLLSSAEDLSVASSMESIASRTQSHRNSKVEAPPPAPEINSQQKDDSAIEKEPIAELKPQLQRELSTLTERSSSTHDDSPILEDVVFVEKQSLKSDDVEMSVKNPDEVSHHNENDTKLTITVVSNFSDGFKNGATSMDSFDNESDSDIDDDVRNNNTNAQTTSASSLALDSVDSIDRDSSEGSAEDIVRMRCENVVDTSHKDDGTRLVDLLENELELEEQTDKVDSSCGDGTQTTPSTFQENLPLNTLQNLAQKVSRNADELFKIYSTLASDPGKKFSSQLLRLIIQSVLMEAKQVSEIASQVVHVDSLKKLLENIETKFVDEAKNDTISGSELASTEALLKKVITDTVSAINSLIEAYQAAEKDLFISQSAQYKIEAVGQSSLIQLKSFADYKLEHFDNAARKYRQEFAGHEHKTILIKSEKLGPGEKMKKVHHADVLEGKLVQLDELQANLRYKVGVMYCKEGQRTEEEFFGNEHGNDAFNKFLSILGEKVPLKGFQGFLAGLDNKCSNTGQETVHTKWNDFEITYHVSTLLPYFKDDQQQIQRKRHIGNDIVSVVFLDGENATFDPTSIRSQFLHVFIVVKQDYSASKMGYRVQVAYRNEMIKFGPSLPTPPVFYDPEELRHYLLAKIINAENAALKSPKFYKPHLRTREAIISDIHSDLWDPSPTKTTPTSDSPSSIFAFSPSKSSKGVRRGSIHADDKMGGEKGAPGSPSMKLKKKGSSGRLMRVMSANKVDTDSNTSLNGKNGVGGEGKSNSSSVLASDEQNLSEGCDTVDSDLESPAKNDSTQRKFSLFSPLQSFRRTSATMAMMGDSTKRTWSERTEDDDDTQQQDGDEQKEKHMEGDKHEKHKEGDSFNKKDVHNTPASKRIAVTYGTPTAPTPDGEVKVADKMKGVKHEEDPKRNLFGTPSSTSSFAPLPKTSSTSWAKPNAKPNNPFLKVASKTDSEGWDEWAEEPEMKQDPKPTATAAGPAPANNKAPVPAFGSSFGSSAFGSSTSSFGSTTSSFASLASSTSSASSFATLKPSTTIAAPAAPKVDAVPKNPFGSTAFGDAGRVSFGSGGGFGQATESLADLAKKGGAAGGGWGSFSTLKKEEEVAKKESSTSVGDGKRKFEDEADSKESPQKDGDVSMSSSPAKKVAVTSPTKTTSTTPTNTTTPKPAASPPTNKEEKKSTSGTPSAGSPAKEGTPKTPLSPSKAKLAVSPKKDEKAEDSKPKEASSTEPIKFGGALGGRDTETIQTSTLSSNVQLKPIETTSTTAFGSSSTSKIVSFGTAASTATSSFASLLQTSGGSDAFKKKENTEDGDDDGEDNLNFEVPIETKGGMQAVEVTTGEEDEETVFQVRCKLFRMNDTDKQWRERGVGALRVNVKHPDAPSEPPSARLVMRSEGSLRLILNVRILPGMPCDIVQEKFVRFASCEDASGKLTTFLAKSSITDLTTTLTSHINTPVSISFQTQKEIEHETKRLQAALVKFQAQTGDWLKAVEGLNGALKEIGDVANWGEAVERDVEVIVGTLRGVKRI
ncbi:GTPase-activating Rap/Ran-GAP domain-like protein 3 [Chytridiales sp. JEL 0842]|nr:GTPase-activating Rap/Ran-GAP domain-like protein 3 [Chytridiales sp. JEL 0842]